MRYQCIIVPVLGALLVASCSQMQQQQAPEKKDAAAENAAKNPPLCLGAVHQVYPEQQFALLRIIGPLPPAGTTLITHPPDGSVSRLGNICVTSDKATRNGIVAADIRAGSVMRGDRVFLYRDISIHTPKEQDEDETPADTPGEPTPTPVASNVVSDIEHPQITNTPALADDVDVPPPADSDSGDDTSIEQEPEQEPSVPLPSGGPGAAPSYLDEIPDKIDGWN